MILTYTPGAVKLTAEQAKQLFSDTDIAAGEQQGHIETHGPWERPASYTALCTSNEWNREVFPHEHGPLHVYGKRTLTRPVQSGYQLEGRVKVNGKSYRGFTSSQLFELPDGKLIDVATIHAVGASLNDK